MKRGNRPIVVSSEDDDVANTDEDEDDDAHDGEESEDED